MPFGTECVWASGRRPFLGFLGSLLLGKGTPPPLSCLGSSSSFKNFVGSSFEHSSNPPICIFNQSDSKREAKGAQK